MRYIEKDLPIERLNLLALREGNSKKPIYQMHKWWARRLGSVFRMLIITTFASAEESEDNIWQKFEEGCALKNKSVVDPFMGGGTTIVEAARLGCTVIGIDINPVAWFITKKEIEPVDPSKLDEAFAQLDEDVGATIRSFYKTMCPKQHEADVIYTFWVKIVACPLCQREIKLFSSYELLHKDSKTILICPSCGYLFENKSSPDIISCPQCYLSFSPKKGITKSGRYVCPDCGATETLLAAAKRKGGHLDAQIFAVEYYCKECGRGFKQADQIDLELYERARFQFLMRQRHLLFPRQKIPTEGRSDPRPVNHGYEYFWQMFNERQLYCLSLLLQGILRIRDKNVREHMLLAFSDCLDANNMFCKYETEYQKVSLLFGLHAYHPIERVAENNVWGSPIGRGSFLKCYEKLKRGKLYGLSKHERTKIKYGDGERGISEQAFPSIGYSFDQIVSGEKTALLLAQSSENMSFIPSGTVDAVITDPPYFDNVAYSELADFFYVWLRLALKDCYPWFEPESSYRTAELVENEKIGKSAKVFTSGLTRVFRECHRILKDDGLLVFTFHHTKRHAWEQIAKALVESGFWVSASPVVRSEGKSGFHSSTGNIRYDVCFVCRKRNGIVPSFNWAEEKLKVRHDAESWIIRVMSTGMAINKVDIFAIVMGKTVAGYTRCCLCVTEGGEAISIEDAIKEMLPFVDELWSQLCLSKSSIAAIRSC
jgi:adenine-specific DNA methylase